MQPRGDHPPRPRRLPGRAGRASRPGRRTSYLLRTTDDERARRSLRRPAGHRGRPSRAGGGLAFSAAAEAGRRRAHVWRWRSRARLVLRALAAPGDARGPLLPAHRGRDARRRCAPTARARPRRLPEARACSPSTAGSSASCAPRSAPTSASGAAVAVPIIFVVALATQNGGPQRRRLRPLRARHRPGDPAGAAAVRIGLDVPADHRARGRRHRRRRGPPRHPEDDPHPLGRAPADLRRQGARDGHLRDRRDRRHGVVALVAGIIASGFNPIITLSGTRCRPGAASAWSGAACSST